MKLIHASPRLPLRKMVVRTSEVGLKHDIDHRAKPRGSVNPSTHRRMGRSELDWSGQPSVLRGQKARPHAHNESAVKAALRACLKER